MPRARTPPGAQGHQVERTELRGSPAPLRPAVEHARHRLHAGDLGPRHPRRLARRDRPRILPPPNRFRVVGIRRYPRLDHHHLRAHEVADPVGDVELQGARRRAVVDAHRHGDDQQHHHGDERPGVARQAAEAELPHHPAHDGGQPAQRRHRQRKTASAAAGRSPGRTAPGPRTAAGRLRRWHPAPGGSTASAGWSSRRSRPRSRSRR